MNGVQSPRILGHPLWAWAADLTTRYDTDLSKHPSGRPRITLKRRCRIARAILWPLCRALTGHRQARGETGYGGGGMLDVFCAYCYYPWQVPVSESPSKAFLVDLFHGPTPEVGP